MTLMRSLSNFYQHGQLHSWNCGFPNGNNVMQRGFVLDIFSA
jgi:hypothetical protein